MQLIKKNYRKMALPAALMLALPCSALAGDRMQPCDEVCLKGFMDAYLEALSKHDASALPVAKQHRYTENGAELELGREGLWVTFGVDPLAETTE